MDQHKKRSVVLIFITLLVIASLLLTGCQTTETPESPGEVPILTVEMTTLSEETPAIDLAEEMKATKPWIFAFVPKEKFYAKTGHLGAYWQPAWEGARQVKILG